jgi:glyoxylase-like metal-dependent hydrolase (beta-lactamase superfamily II)
VVIDPGGDLPNVERAIARAGIAVDKIWLTHGHIDHVGGAAELKARLKVSIEGPHWADLFLLQHVAETARSFGIANAADVTPDRWLKDGDQVQVGQLTFDVLHCPGHSPGSVVYFNPAQRLAVVGDVLFAGSVGRTDLPGGDARQLLNSIRDKLMPLGDDVAIISGHGPVPSARKGQTILFSNRGRKLLVGPALNEIGQSRRQHHVEIQPELRTDDQPTGAPRRGPLSE